ncbi:MAG TPA: metal-dependent hydrolase [Vicinamibacterales bacterium]
MDNVTHTLFALTLARTPLGRYGRGTTAALVLASNAPDIDIVTALGGTANYLAWHRGPTHGPLGVVGLGVVTAALVSLWRPPSGGPIPIRLKPDPTSFMRLLAVSIIGVLLHILMDLPTSYGTRLLSPFSWRWYAIDLMPIIDVYLWMILAAGLLAGSWRPGARQKSAAIALALMAANYGIRVTAHQEALATAARVHGPALPAPCDPSAAFGSLLDSWPQSSTWHPGSGRCLVDTAAIPSFGSPFDWRVIAQLPDEYVEIYGDDAGRIPNRWTPQVAAAARTRTAQVLLGFSRFPAASAFPQPSGGTTVQFTDVRFAMGPAIRQLQARRSSLFTVTVRVGPHNEILEERLGE